MDILQESLVTAYVEVERGRYQPRDGVPFAAYVKGIARNKIREARRRNRRAVPLDDLPDAVFVADGDSPESAVERREQRAFLHEGLSQLPQSRRLVMERYLKGHSTTEIASALNMSVDAVRQHKCRGLRSLRALRSTQHSRRN
jgi:RNA polymerase sigma-70 factor (ECF subfamily)